MIALVLVAALLDVTPNPIEVAPGETIVVEVRMEKGGFVHGAGFGTEETKIARARGWMSPNASQGTVTIEGLKKGRTRLVVEYIVGMGVWRHPVADILVDHPCVAPTVALSESHVRMGEHSEMTVTAMTTGTDVHIEWYEGTKFRRLGATYTIRDLPLGTYRYTARVSNRCGAAVSEELVVEVVPPRRRAVRR